MNRKPSNEFENEEPTRDSLRPLPLAREIIGNLTIELTRTPGDVVMLDVTVGSDVVKSIRLKDISDFQAGRLFERECVAYTGIVK